MYKVTCITSDCKIVSLSLVGVVRLGLMNDPIYKTHHVVLVNERMRESASVQRQCIVFVSFAVSAHCRQKYPEVDTFVVHKNTSMDPHPIRRCKWVGASGQLYVRRA